VAVKVSAGWNLETAGISPEQEPGFNVLSLFSLMTFFFYHIGAQTVKRLGKRARAF
jgi:hypothetical protein